jgi:sarcosine oxidase subunit gamma
MSRTEAGVGSPTPLQQAGIETRDRQIGDVRLREMKGLALARLRLFRSTAETGMPLADLPTQTGHCGGTNPEFLCIAPREWLAISRTLSPPELLAAAQQAIDDSAGAAFDLSDAKAVFRLTGAAAPWLLSKLSSLDFLAGSRQGPHCASCRMADAAVTIYYHQDEDGARAFDVIGDRSIAAYLWGLLEASAAHANDLLRATGGTA